jgi:AcrR family transcriptional regulator
MQLLGPGELTLAAIAAEAGVTAGALAQRFGSKRALLLALSDGAAASAGALLHGLRADHASPLAAVRAYAVCLAGLASSPSALARNLAYLQIDLTDPDFRAGLAVQGRAARRGLVELLAEAVDRGELEAGADPDRLARQIEVLLNGALFTWAVYQEGSVTEFLRDSVEWALQPYVGAV